MDTRSVPSDATATNDSVSDPGSAPLTFSVVDGLAFAARKGKLQGRRSVSLAVNDIGPLLELIQLSDHGVLPPADKLALAAVPENAAFCHALRSCRGVWVCQSTKRLGFIQTTASYDDDQANHYQFGMAAKSAAISAGFASKVAAQLVAAVIEMIDNVYVHSSASQTGLAAFYARPGSFEFAVTDRGRGILRSLQENSEYAGLSDHGDALQIALTDGCSRFGSNTNHGNGFRPLFTGLSNLNGALRFRSGDHALTIDGRNPRSIPWTKIAKPQIPGFLASAMCGTASLKGPGTK